MSVSSASMQWRVTVADAPTPSTRTRAKPESSCGSASARGPAGSPPAVAASIATHRQLIEARLHSYRSYVASSGAPLWLRLPESTSKRSAPRPPPRDEHAARSTEPRVVSVMSRARKRSGTASKAALIDMAGAEKRLKTTPGSPRTSSARAGGQTPHTGGHAAWGRTRRVGVEAQARRTGHAVRPNEDGIVAHRALARLPRRRLLRRLRR